MPNLVRKLDFSMLAISFGLWPTKQSAREYLCELKQTSGATAALVRSGIKDTETEIIFRAKIIEHKARRKLVQRLFRQ
jgi:hypothetical protein